MKSMQYPSAGLTGRPQLANRGSSGAFVGNEAAEGTTYDPLIGKKVWTRWPEDNHFYEAVITDYNPVEVYFTFWLHNVPVHMRLLLNLAILKNFQGRHALVYDINTTNETWEWVNLKEVILMLPSYICSMIVLKKIPQFFCLNFY